MHEYMKPSEVLKQARKLIENPENWIQGTMCRDKNDHRTLIDSHSACKFCSIGAYTRILHNNGYDKKFKNIVEFYMDSCLIAGYFSISHFNDNSKHQDVLMLFDKAIHLAESEGN